LPADTAYFHARYRCEHTGRCRSRLPDRRSRGPRPVCRHGPLGNDGPGRLVRRGGRLLLHRRRRGTQLTRNGQRGLFQRCLGLSTSDGSLVRPAAVARRQRGRQRCVLPLAPSRPGELHQVAQSGHRTQRQPPESEDGFFSNDPTSSAAVAFWYQTGEPKPFGRLAGWHAAPRAMAAATPRAGVPESRNNGQFPGGSPDARLFRARPVLSWSAAEPGAVLTLPFEGLRDGKVCGSPDGGPCTRIMAHSTSRSDGKQVLALDFRAPEYSKADVLLGTHELASGSPQDLVPRLGQLGSGRPVSSRNPASAAPCHSRPNGRCARITKPISSVWVSAARSTPIGWPMTSSRFTGDTRPIGHHVGPLFEGREWLAIECAARGRVSSRREHRSERLEAPLARPRRSPLNRSHDTSA